MKKLLSLICAAAIIATMFGVSAVSAFALSAPKLKVSNDTKGVKLSWNKVSSAKKYVVAHKLSTAKSFSNLKTVTANTFTDTKAKAGKKYVYTVKAVSGSDSAVSAQKSIVRVAAPTGVKAVQLQNKGNVVRISWKKAAGAKSYEIYYAKLSGSKTGKLRKLNTFDTIKATHYDDDFFELSDGNYYRFKVRAVNGGSKSAFSSASAKFGALMPTMCMYTHTDDYKGVRVLWTSVNGAKGYIVYRSVGKNGKFTQVTKGKFHTTKYMGITVFYYDDKTLSKGERCKYYIVAYNGSIKSPKSDDSGTTFYHNYDLGVQVGENYTGLSTTYSNMKGVDSKATIISDNSSVAAVTAAKKSDGTYQVKITGIKAGYTYIRLKSPEMEINEKYRVYVSDDPVYDLEMQVGDTEMFLDLIGGNTRLILAEAMSELSVSATSSDEDVVEAEKTKSDVRIEAVGEGTAKVKIKIYYDFGDEKMYLLDDYFRIKVG